MCIVCCFRQVSSSEELLTIVNRGIRQRAVTSTLIHQHSSRSHLVVTVHISQASSSTPTDNVSAASSTHSLDRTITPVHSAESTPVVCYKSSHYENLILVMIHAGISRRFSSNHSAKFMPGVLHCILLARTNRRCCSSSREYSTESYIKLQFVDLAGSECIGNARDYWLYGLVAQTH